MRFLCAGKDDFIREQFFIRIFYRYRLMRIIIIGAGAAGCFAAINIKRNQPDAVVTVLESGRKPLAKVAVTGGGRCNLTNSFADVKSLDKVYPRGGRLMKRLLREFSHEDTCAWFEREGVRLVTQEDQCVFPKSQDAMEIVNTLMRLMGRLGVVVKTGHRVERIEKRDGMFVVGMADESIKELTADAVVVTTGGGQTASAFRMLDGLDLEIVPPVPSLFSLCLPGNPVTDMMGTVVEDAAVSLAGTKFKAQGPLLVTHWGMSGPAILKLSSYAARWLNERDYKATLLVNWMSGSSESQVLEQLQEYCVLHKNKQLSNVYPQQLNSRLWHYLILRSKLSPEIRWGELGRKGLNRLVCTLTNQEFRVDGKNRFKDEFVTCGGIALSNVNPATLECRTCPGLYFAGEVLDVDAVTGGFNLQAAWTMGYVVAKSL